MRNEEKIIKYIQDNLRLMASEEINPEYIRACLDALNMIEGIRFNCSPPTTTGSSTTTFLL